MTETQSTLLLVAPLGICHCRSQLREGLSFHLDMIGHHSPKQPNRINQFANQREREKKPYWWQKQPRRIPHPTTPSQRRNAVMEEIERKRAK